jgi:tRNA modification GTPase
VQLADTAGLRDAVDELEMAGMELARDALARADLAIVVHDATAGLSVPGVTNCSLDRRSVLQVLNKIDLLPRAGDRPATCIDGKLLPTSALTGEGIPELLRAIAQSLVPKIPPAGTAVPFTAPQVQHLQSARAAIDEQDAPLATMPLHALLKA